MLKLLAPVDNIRFDIEDAFEKQTYSVISLPFNGMDSKSILILVLIDNKKTFFEHKIAFRISNSGLRAIRTRHVRQGQSVSVQARAR
jgi:hypothetical protein